MSKNSKAYREAAEKVDRDNLYTPAGSRAAGQGDVVEEAGRDRRGGHPAGRRPAQGRPDGARHRQPAARHRQDRPRRGVRRRRQGRGGQGRRRRHRRQRRPDRKDPGRLPGLRRRDRDAGSDGQGRPHRPRARPARPDAEPEDRHRHPRRRQGRRPTSRAARSTSASTSRPTCTSSSARRRSTRRALAENYGAALDEILRAKPSSSKGRYLKKIVVSTTTGPGIPVDPAVTRNFAEA